MFDVLPPHEENKSARSNRRARLIKPEVSSVPRQLINPGPRTVQVNWKLPARLRQPIRQQLAKEREKKRQRQAIIRFDRRPINTRPVLEVDKQDVPKKGGITLPSRRLFNRGAEHHTGDTYRQSRPQLKMAAPPYLGSHAVKSFAQPQESVRAQANAIRPSGKTSDHSNREIQNGRKRVRFDMGSDIGKRRNISKSKSVKPRSIPIIGERDVPFEWEEKTSAVQISSDLFVQPVKTKGSSISKPGIWPFTPINFTIWPKFLSFSGRGVTNSTELVKKKSDQTVMDA